MSKARKLLALTLSVPLCLTSSFAAPPAPTRYVDGVSPEACAALGIRLDRGNDDSRGRPGNSNFGGPLKSIAPTGVPNFVAPAPAPPPSVESVVVAGGPSQRENTERYPRATPNPVRQVAQEPVSTFSIDVDTAAYANVRRFLKDGSKPPHDAVRVEEMVNYFDYGYAKPSKANEPFAITTALVSSPWSKQRKILHIGVQGYDIPARAQPPMNLVFLMDTSGSMQDDDRLPLARKAISILVNQLRPQDHVSLVAYAGSAGAVLGPTGGEQKLKIRCAMQTLDAGGSTAGGEGLALAYALAQHNFQKGAVNRIILLTDGDFNVGISDPAKLEDFVSDKRKSGIYLSVYGFGRDNYNDTMMQTLSQKGNGTAAYIDTMDEARKLFRDDFSGSIFPIADDVKIQVEFNPRVVREYRLIGYETRLLNREDFNNDQVDAGEVGSRASVTALYELTMAGVKPSSDPLRYVSDGKTAPGSTNELGFLKLRYKLPGQPASKLMQRSIASADSAASAAAAPEATRWALAVAGFGEKLRGSPWISADFDWNSIQALAQGARGRDVFGLRAEFVQLVRSAAEARSVNERP